MKGIDKWKWFNGKEKKTWKNYPRIKIKCKGCGKEFTVYKSLGNMKYCSKECFRKFYIYTDEHKKRISEGVRKHLPLTAFKKGAIPWNKGKHVANNRIFFENNPKRKKIKKTGYKLTKNLAYILGVLKGDGSLVSYNNSCALRLSVNDLNFAQKFKEYGEKQFGLVGHYKMVKDKWHKNIRHQISFYSKDLEFLRNFNLDYILENDEFKREFINGFIDSEGHVTKQKTIIIYNTNKELLEFCQKILSSFGIKSHLGYSRYYRYYLQNGSNAVCYRLFIGKKQLHLFYQNFKFSIPRKQERLELKGGEHEKMDMVNSIGININSDG